MVEQNDKVFIDEFDSEDDPIFIEKVLMPFLSDIFGDYKMRGGKDCKGFTRPMWLDYTRLPEAISMRLF